MSPSSVAHAILLLSAACGGAVALIALGLGLRAAPGSALAAALGHSRPAVGVAWRLIPLALIAAAAGHRPAGEWLLLACVGLAGLHALVSAFEPDVEPSRELAAAQVAAIALAVLWVGRLVPAGGVGQSYPLGVAAAAALFAAGCGLLPGRWRLWGMFCASGGLALAAWGMAVGLFQAPDLWQPVAAGCAFAAGVGLLLSVSGHASGDPAVTDTGRPTIGPAQAGQQAIGTALPGQPAGDVPPPLAFAIPLLGAVLILLLTRHFGVGGTALAGIGLLPLAIHPARGAARLGALLTALFAGRGLLQWALEIAGLGPTGLDLTQPYAFAALCAGVALAAAPPVAAPYLSSGISRFAAGVALAAVVPLVAIGVQAMALPALLMGLFAAGLVTGSLRAGAAAPVAGLIAYAGAIAALFGPRLADLGILPRPWRLGAVLGAALLVGLASAVALVSRREAPGEAPVPGP